VKTPRFLSVVTCIFTSLLLLNACSGGGNSGTGNGLASDPGTTASLSSILVTPGAASIQAGSAQQFSAIGTYSDGSTRDISATVQWSSSNASVASVSSSGMVNGAASGQTTVIAKSGTIQGTASLTVSSAGGGSGSSPTLISITVSAAASSIPVNTAQQFAATGSYDNGSSADITALVTWNSSLPATAAISTTGSATAITAGTTTISATLNGITGSMMLTVTAPTLTGILISPDDLTLGIGINQQYVATAIYSDGTVDDLASGVTWSSSTTSTATIDGSGLASTAGAGQTTLTATVGSFSDTTTLTVVPANLISISVSPNPSTIAVGTTQPFTAVGTFDDGSTQLLTSVTWTSSQPGVATVDTAIGVAAAVGAGTSSVTATSGSVSGSAQLTVTAATLISLTVTPVNAATAPGTTKQFTATGTFSDSSTQDVTASALWSSSNPGAATIGNVGLASGLLNGTTTITAAIGSVSDSTTLTISTAHLVSITVSPSNPRINKGTQIKFTATGQFSDGSTSTQLSGLTWKSSKPNIAQVRGSGIARGKKNGSVTITAGASGVKGTTTLTVGSGALSSIVVTPANSTVALGSTQQFTATGHFSDGSTQDITMTTHFSSSVASVATIANAPSVAGVATTNGVGTTVIGANSKSVTSSTTLTVQ
jgi:trimeric autotransporter adhesin